MAITQSSDVKCLNPHAKRVTGEGLIKQLKGANVSKGPDVFIPAPLLHRCVHVGKLITLSVSLSIRKMGLT